MAASPFFARIGLLATGLISANLTGALSIAAPPTNTAGQFVNGNGNGGITRVVADTYMGTGGGYASFTGRAARGTASAPTALQSGDEITHLSARGYGATGFSANSQGAITIFAAENWTDTAQGTRMGFLTTAPGGVAISEKVRIWGDGGVTISTTLAASPGPKALSVGDVFTCLADTASPWTATYDATKGSKTFGMLNTVSGVSTNGPLIIGFGNTGFQTASTSTLIIGSGNNSTNTGNSNALVVGFNNVLPATASNAVIIGNGAQFATSNCSSSVTIGRVSDSGLNCVVIGRTAVGAQDSVVIGSGATASGSSGAVVLGRSASSGGFANSGSIGNGALATAANQIRIGSTATRLALNVTGNCFVEQTTASTSSISGALVVSGGTGISGRLWLTLGTRNTVISSNGSVGTSDNILIGDGATNTDPASNGCVAIGKGAIASNGGNTGQVAIGTNANASGNSDQVAIGANAVATAQFGIAIGGSSSATTGSQAMAVGIFSSASALGGIALGTSTSVGAGHDYGAALGANAVTSKARQIMLGNASNHTEITIPTTTAATSLTSGALVVSGGGGFAGDLYAATHNAVQGTIVAAASALSTTSTWNNAGVTFTGWKQNVTDTASAAGSLLADLQVGGTSKFRVDKTGAIVVRDGQATSAVSAYFGSATANTQRVEIWGNATAGGGGVRVVQNESLGRYGDMFCKDNLLCLGVAANFTLGSEQLQMSNGGGGYVSVVPTTAASSTITGALRVSGGVGIAGALYTGGIVVTPASAVGSAGLRLPHGVAPTAPVDGDVWTTTTGMFARINGATVGPFGAGGGGAPGGANTNIQYNNGGAFAGSANFTYNNAIKQVQLTSGGSALTFDGTTPSITASNASGDLLTLSNSEVTVGLVSGSYSKMQPVGALLLHDVAAGLDASIVAATGLLTLATSSLDGLNGVLTLSDSTPHTLIATVGATTTLAASAALTISGTAVSFSGSTSVALDGPTVTATTTGGGNIVLDAAGQVLSKVGGTTKLTVDTSGVVATVPVTGTRLIGTQGTITTNVQGLSTTATWNSAGTTFTGWLQNITDTASAAASLFVDLQVAGVSKFNVGKTGSATIALGTITTNIRAIDIAATWNSAGTTFTGIKQNITNTASGANSLLMDLQVGGSTVFAVTKAGGAYIQGLTYGTTGLEMTAQASNPSVSSPGTTVWVDNSSANLLRFSTHDVAYRDGLISYLATSGGSITPDGTVTDILKAELTANTTIQTPTMLDGQTMILIIYNTATAYTLSWAGTYDFGTAGAPTAPASNTAVIATVIRTGTHYYVSTVSGFATPV